MLFKATAAPLSAHWWIPLVRGLVAIVFGLAVLFYPLHAVGVFIILFGAFALADGGLNIVTALRFAHPDRGSWWTILVQGIFGVAIGIATFVWPGWTAAALGTLVALWAVVTGVLEIAAAFKLRRNVPGEIFLIVSGILSVAIGAWLFLSPIVALLALIWLIGVYAILGGFALIALSLRLRQTASPRAPAA